MMVVGEQTIFLSHLPMFHSEHRFQVIVEAAFEQNGTSLTKFLPTITGTPRGQDVYAHTAGSIRALAAI